MGSLLPIMDLTNLGMKTLIIQTRPPCQWIGGGPIWVLNGGRTRTRAAALASAATFCAAPERTGSGGVRSPTICEEVNSQHR